MSKRITLEEEIKAHKIIAGIEPENNAFQQVVEWLEELQKWRTFGKNMSKKWAEMGLEAPKASEEERHENTSA